MFQNVLILHEGDSQEINNLLGLIDSFQTEDKNHLYSFKLGNDYEDSGLIPENNIPIGEIKEIHDRNLSSHYVLSELKIPYQNNLKTLYKKLQIDLIVLLITQNEINTHYPAIADKLFKNPMAPVLVVKENNDYGSMVDVVIVFETEEYPVKRLNKVRSSLRNPGARFHLVKIHSGDIDVRAVLRQMDRNAGESSIDNYTLNTIDNCSSNPAIFSNRLKAGLVATFTGRTRSQIEKMNMIFSEVLDKTDIPILVY